MDDLKDTTSTRVSKAMRSLPRDHFIEMSDPSVVLGRSIPPTNAVSEILHHARVCPEHKVLQIGTGAGYVAALLSKLAAQVVTIEINPSISRFAQSRFNKLGLANLVLREQDGSEGAPDLGPYDRIMVSSPRIKNTQRLLEQLASGGLLIALEQGENNTHILTRYEVSELGATLRRELALVDFSKDTGMTLLDMGMVDQVMLSEARRLARRKKLPVIKVLREQLNMEDATLYRRLAEENGMTFSPVDELLPRVQPQLMEAFSRSFLDSHHIIPLEVSERNLLVATDDPDSSVEDILRMHPYDRVVKVLVTPNDFKRLWTTVELSLQGDAKKLWGAVAESREKQQGEHLLSWEKIRIEAHPITRCNALLLDAISDGASDLHIEQYKERTRIRLRVDGDLHDINLYELSPLETRREASATTCASRSSDGRHRAETGQTYLPGLQDRGHTGPGHPGRAFPGGNTGQFSLLRGQGLRDLQRQAHQGKGGGGRIHAGQLRNTQCHIPARRGGNCRQRLWKPLYCENPPGKFLPSSSPRRNW